MRRGSGWSLGPILGAATALVFVMALIWSAAPDALRGLLLLVGGVSTVVLYAGLYAIVRRDHGRW